MTPHAAIESMLLLERMYGKNLANNFKLDAWPDLKDTLAQQAVHFDFGEAVPSEAHLEFSSDMMDKGLFRLPYPAVFMTGNCSPKTGILAMSHAEDTVHPLTLIVFAGCVLGDSVTRIDGAPVYAITVDCEPDQPSKVRWASLTLSGSHKSRKTGDLKSEDDMQHSAQAAMQLAMGWPILLMSKDVEAVKLEAPHRLNRAREARGKLPIRERFIVRIRPEARERQRLAAEGFRTSPKMHWRRGHFRKVSENLVVPVAPTIVNAEPGSKPIAKSYKVG